MMLVTYVSIDGSENPNFSYIPANGLLNNPVI